MASPSSTYGDSELTAFQSWGWWPASENELSTAGDSRISHAGLSKGHGWSDSLPRHFVATASSDGTVRVWDVDALVCVNELLGHQAPVNHVVWAEHARNDMLLLASASSDGVVIIWALNMAGALQEQFILVHHEQEVTSLKFTLDGRKLISAGADGMVCIWRVSSGKLSGKLLGHSRGITHLATLAISGALAIVTCDTSGKWCLWDLQSRDCVVSGKEPHGCSMCAFTPRVPSLSPPRPLLLTCQWSTSKRESTVHMWDIFDQKASANSTLQPLYAFEGLKGRIASISFTVDSSGHPLFAIGCMDGVLTLMDLSSRTILSQIRHAHVNSEGEVMPILQVAFSADGAMLFSSGADCSIKVWSTADMEVLLTLQGHSSPVTCITAASEGRVLASGSQCGQLGIWSLELVEELACSPQPNFPSLQPPLGR